MDLAGDRCKVEEYTAIAPNDAQREQKLQLKKDSTVNIKFRTMKQVGKIGILLPPFFLLFSSSFLFCRLSQSNFDRLFLVSEIPCSRDSPHVPDGRHQRGSV
jgi:hypothetical protein